MPTYTLFSILAAALFIGCSPPPATSEAGDDPAAEDETNLQFVDHQETDGTPTPAEAPPAQPPAEVEPETEPEPETTPDPETDPGPGPVTKPPETQPEPDPPAEPDGAVPPNINVSTYINLGDSAGEGCCTPSSNKWSYYNMMVSNDGSKYPQWAGLDLPAMWPTLQTKKNWADSGDTSGDVKQDQLPKFAGSYSAPVIVTIHVGGNDFNDHDIMDFVANPAKIEADGKLLGQNLDEILTFFADTSRFPAGAYVFVATIFSPTDDMCSFEGKSEFDGKWCKAIRNYGCLAGGWVDQLKAYNAEIASAVTKHPHATLADTHGAFLGHGMNHDNPENPAYAAGAESYFNSDCVHPNAAGHDAIRATFMAAIAGVLPD